jgi:hypothetical protein
VSAPRSARTEEAGVGDQGDDQVADQQPVGRRAPAGGDREGGGQRQQQRVPHRVGERDHQLQQGLLEVAEVGDHHQDPGDEAEPGGDDGGVQQRRPVPRGGTAPQEQRQRTRQHRVARQVQGVGQRREGLDVQDQVVDGEQHVAEHEQPLPGGQQPPGAAGGRPVAADPAAIASAAEAPTATSGTARGATGSARTTPAASAPAPR